MSETTDDSRYSPYSTLHTFDTLLGTPPVDGVEVLLDQKDFIAQLTTDASFNRGYKHWLKANGLDSPALEAIAAQKEAEEAAKKPLAAVSKLTPGDFEALQAYVKAHDGNLPPYPSA